MSERDGSRGRHVSNYFKLMTRYGAGFVWFDDRDTALVHAAYRMAIEKQEEYRDQHGTKPRIVLWRYPKAHGPWSALALVGTTDFETDNVIPMTTRMRGVA